MLIVMIGWVFFSAESFGRAFHYIAMLFGGAGLPFINGNFLYQLRNQGILFVILILAAGSAPNACRLPTSMNSPRVLPGGSPLSA